MPWTLYMCFGTCMCFDVLCVNLYPLLGGYPVFPDPGSAISPAPGKNVLEMTSFSLNRDQLHNHHCLMIGCHTFFCI